ncbi:MAG: hypothetical protein LUC33_00580, partial [Prevotellaceae bacterium]|nr:hypothetical protein [Prevotellaceae bacterium]
MATKKQVISYGFMITAPPQVHFAFNPWRFTLTKNNDAADEVATIVFAGETREPYDGAAEFDVQRYVQTKFDGIPDERLKAIDYAQPLAGYGLYAGFGEAMSLYDADDKLLETHLAMDWFSNEQGWYALWGAISRGEEYGADETLRWWVNYPFTVDFLSLSDEFGIELDAGLPETDPLTGDSLTIWKSFAASGPSVRLFSPSAAWKEATAEGAAEDGDDGDGNASRWPEIMDAASIKVRVSDHV